MSTGQSMPAGGAERRPQPREEYVGQPVAEPRPVSPPASASPSASQEAAAGGAVPAAAATPAAPPAATGTPAAPSAGPQRVTRAGMVWAAVVAALVLLILLIIFILQNQDQVAVRYLGMEGVVPLGMALFIASVTGGVLVAIAGAARILQLRATAHRARLKETRGSGTRR
ncbi:LapA family protein [Arthrobacter sp. D1-29]